MSTTVELGGGVVMEQGPAWLTGSLFGEEEARESRRRRRFLASLRRRDRWRRAYGRTNISHQALKPLTGVAGCAAKLYAAIMGLAPVDDSWQLVEAKFDLNYKKVVGGRVQLREGGGGFRTSLKRLAESAGIAINTARKHLVTLSTLGLVWFESSTIGTFVALAGYERQFVGTHREARIEYRPDALPPDWLFCRISKNGHRSPPPPPESHLTDYVDGGDPRQEGEGGDLRSRLSDFYAEIDALPDPRQRL